MLYNRDNFHKNTFCVFNASETPQRDPDYESRSGSRYWFDENGVHRESSHWGRAAKCKWRLAQNHKGGRMRSGFAAWASFLPDNDSEKLYFIKIEAGAAHYFHKGCAFYAGEFLRTSSGTQKRLRQIRSYLERDDFSGYVLEQLLNSDKQMFEVLKC